MTPAEFKAWFAGFMHEKKNLSTAELEILKKAVESIQTYVPNPLPYRIWPNEIPQPTIENPGPYRWFEVWGGTRTDPKA